MSDLGIKIKLTNNEAPTFKGLTFQTKTAVLKLKQLFFIILILL